MGWRKGFESLLSFRSFGVGAEFQELDSSYCISIEMDQACWSLEYQRYFWSVSFKYAG